ncbi:MAG: hypothetical protein VX938_05545, partial [Myxococcota bacterium]|nr:hypothetical protein [Myxococcota bacterium]
GQADVDPDWLGYYGESLGGIRASHVLALSERLKVGMIAVGGARLGTIIEEGADFGIIRVFMEEVLGGADAAARFYPVMQAAVDPGDPVMFAPRVLSRRLVDGPPPHVLLTAAVGDFSVPNEASADLCRSLGIPMLGDDWIGVGLATGLEGPVVQGNLPGGTTGAFFQYDRITNDDGTVVRANHGNVPYSPESVFQLERFLTTWLEGGAPEILDPYDALGTPALSEMPPG